MADPTQSYERCIEAAGIAIASGDHPNAERALRAAIQAVEGHDDSHFELAAALIKLGTLKQEMGSLAEALDLFRRALEIGERALGNDHLGLIPALKGLGTTRILQGAPEGAEPTLMRALAISERHLGEDHPDQVILLNDLTRLYLKQSAHAFAEPLLLRLLEMKRSKGEDHPEVATVLASLASVRQALGRHEAAEQLWRRVLTIRERTLAPNHFAIATATEHLGETCSARGKIHEALQLFQRALTIREATLGKDHASLRSSRERIADLELQASEEGFSLGADVPASVIVPSAARPRLMSDEELGRTLGSALREKPAVAPVRESPAIAPATDVTFAVDRPVARPMEQFALPTADGLTMTPVKQAASDAGSYLDVLHDIKHEIEEGGLTAPLTNETSSGSLVRSVSAFLQRRRAAAIVGIGVITLPLAAWGVAGAARSSQAKWVENKPATASAQVEQQAVAVASPTEIAKLAADSANRANAARSDKSSATKGEVKDEPTNITMPTAPAVVIRVDSVRGIAATPFTPGGESVLRHLSASSAVSSGNVAAGTDAVRARMIGALPTPRYPAQQLMGRTGGEVRVRFDVDTLGRPVMSTFTVVGSPVAALSKAVKDVIPGIRFEPARTPWPENRPIVETVELAFQFGVIRGR